MIPDYELNVLLLAEVEAMDLAEEGDVLEGYECLAAGLQRAREAYQRNEPGAEELCRQWALLVDSYCHRYGVPLE